MKIILNKDVKSLGEEGDVCEVKDGYARNFLLPSKIAVPYNKLHVNNFKIKAKAIAQRKEIKRGEAKGLKDRIEQEISLELIMPSADSGRLFGAVTNVTIAENLAHHGIDVERKRIEIPERTIKIVGNYTVKIRLYDQQVASLKVVVRSLELEKAEREAAERELAEAAAALAAEQEAEETEELVSAEDTVETPQDESENATSEENQD